MSLVWLRTELAAWRAPKCPIPLWVTAAVSWVPPSPCPFPVPMLPKDWGIDPGSSHVCHFGGKGHATHPSAPKQKPSQGSFRGCRVLFSSPAVSSPRVTLAVAMGEVVARSWGRWAGSSPGRWRCWVWASGFWERVNYPMEEGQILLGVSPWWLGTAEPGAGPVTPLLPACRSPSVRLSVAAQRRRLPTAHRRHHPPPCCPPPGLSLLSLRFCTR